RRRHRRPGGCGGAAPGRGDPGGTDARPGGTARRRRVVPVQRRPGPVHQAVSTLMDVYDAIARRRDTRAEFIGEPVPEEVLRRILEAAHRAPSVGMSQPWVFVTVRDPVVLATFRDHVATEREVFAASLSGERAETFARIKVEGIVES